MQMTKVKANLWQDSPSVWTLKIDNGIGQEDFQSLSAGEDNAILQRLVKAQAQNLVIDLAAAERFGSLGLQLLLLLHKQLAPQNIQIVLRHPSNHLQRLLRIMQFDRIFRIVVEDDGPTGDERQDRVLV